MSKITILDGGMGQELIHRSSMPPSPLWSAQVMMDEPEIVEAVHRDYFDVGADILTLNTYSATPERLARDASEDLFEPLQARAIEIAKRVKGDSNLLIAGCLPPLFGSYHPENTPEFQVCLETYQRIVNFQKDHVDIFLCETMSSIKEANSATAAAKESGNPVWCALSVNDTDGKRLRSGELVEDAVEVLIKLEVDAILFNCSAPEAISEGMPILAKAGVPFGAYANGFTKADDLEIGGTVDGLETRKDLDPQQYAEHCSNWVSMGATIIGGCCEVGPAHIEELKRRFG